MAENINVCTVSGNLTRDAELRQTKSGSPVLSFGIAVNERRRDASGEYSEYANFFTCVMFGKRAEAVAKYLTKGTKVVLTGKLTYSAWEQDGTKRSKVEITVDNLEFNGRAPQKAAPQPTTAPTAPAMPAQALTSDIPF